MATVAAKHKRISFLDIDSPPSFYLKIKATEKKRVAVVIHLPSPSKGSAAFTATGRSPGLQIIAFLRLPGFKPVTLRRKLPVTVAGPHRIFTGFPFKPSGTCCWTSFSCKGGITYLIPYKYNT
jgi:hypothetical protein